MNIVKVTQNEFNEGLDLISKLWSDYSIVEMQTVLDSPREEQFLGRDSQGNAIAFLHLSLRYEYVPGANQSPVAFIEGIYVRDEESHKSAGYS